MVQKRIYSLPQNIGDNSNGTETKTPGARYKLIWGPFHLPGILGGFINTYAVIYITIVVFFSFWPTQMNPTVTTINYSVVGTFGTVILAVIYYVLRARKVYSGPIVEVGL